MNGARGLVMVEVTLHEFPIQAHLRYPQLEEFATACAQGWWTLLFPDSLF